MKRAGSFALIPRHARRAGCALVTALMGAALLALALSGPAFAAGGSWWQIDSEVAPTHLPPEAQGEPGEGEVIVDLSDLGDAPVTSSPEPVTITDKLPAGLTATAVSSSLANCPTGAPSNPIVCTLRGTLSPYERLALAIKVRVAIAPPAGTETTLPNEVSVEGGGAPSAASVQQLTVSEEPTPFGAQHYGFALYNEHGTPAVQAGSHPYELTTTLVMNQTAERQPVALPDNLRFELPPGLLGDPTAVAQCALTQFFTTGVEGHEVSIVDQCPAASVVGVATATVHLPIVDGGIYTQTVPVFNLVPAYGEPARLGFEVRGLVFVTIDTSVQSGGDYNVVASVEHADETGALLSSQVTLWGVPGAASHNSSRGWECVEGSTHDQETGLSCPTTTSLAQTPFLISPTYCTVSAASEPVVSTAEMDSWAEPGKLAPPTSAIWSGPLEEPLAFEGCEDLPFTPSLQVDGDTQRGGTPTGLRVGVELPQTTTLAPEGRAEADLRDTTVTLPEGVQLNPSAANGLEACSEEEMEGDVSQAEHERFKRERSTELQRPPTTAAAPPLSFPDAPAQCPPASKLGIVHVKTPLLANELQGAVYLASPAPNGEAGRNPFNSLVALYLVAESQEAGVRVKLAGKGEVNQASGQLTTSFQEAPQVPFEELKLELFGGERASLSTPARCGAYGSQALFTPWSDAPPARVLSPAQELNIGEECASGGTLGFSPSFLAADLNTQAGAFSPFEVDIDRPDGQQPLSGVTVSLPAGIAALLSTVTPCQEPPAGVEWACGPESLIGHATAWSGEGGEPVVLGGEVFLTTGYDGAPFGLLVRTLAQAGPFDLGYVNVRSRISVNPQTAAVSVTTDPGPRDETLPTMIKGIPVDLKHLRLTVDRPDFEFNPTNCSPMKIAGTLEGAEGASAGVSSPFQVAGCQSLPFAPALSASAVGDGSKADGTTFKVVVKSGGTDAGGVAQAGIAKVDLQLPKQLSSRLPTLQKACTEAAFNANPASCPEGSVIGAATIRTPVLKSALAGPAYLVSHGNAAFPDVEFVLQGEGIKLVLDGKTQIKDGITYSKFESAPDAPFTVFETVLPAGPHGVLTPNVAESKHFDLCGETLQMPTTITGQNGKVIEHDTKIAIEGCAAVKAAKAKKLTNAQKLAKALKGCRKKYARSKARRARCERQARRRYPLHKSAHKTKYPRKQAGKRTHGAKR